MTLRVVLLEEALERFNAETMPCVTVFASSSPPGLPMAITVEPTFRFAVLPMLTGTRVSACSFTCNTARSRAESVPVSVALTFSPLGMSTWKLLPPSTTWKLVST